MKTFISLAILFGSITTSFAQVAIITDKDGYTNMRADRSVKSVKTGEAKTGDLVYIYNEDNPDSNWKSISTTDDKDKSGYVYHTNLMLLETYPKLPIVSENENLLAFKDNGIEVNIVMDTFNYTTNRSKFTKYQDTEILTHYKGQTMYGTDGTIPTKHYTSITVKTKGKTISIPTNAFENLFQPSNDSRYVQVYLDNKTSTIYIVSNNSDGAAGYIVVWVIKNDKFESKNIFAPLY